MSGQAVTEWFTETRPTEVGVYERDLNAPGAGPWFSFWTGSDWLMARPSVESAAHVSYACLSGFPASLNLPWRGLASDPNAS